jgi:hypothetical protein
VGHYGETFEAYRKKAAEATRPTANTRALEMATVISPFELVCELVEFPVWDGAGVRVELKREDDEMLLLPPGRPDEELEGREEGPEEELGKELLSPAAIRLPVPQPMGEPSGWVFSGAGTLFPFASVMVNLVVQYFWVEEEEANSKK